MLFAHAGKFGIVSYEALRQMSMLQYPCFVGEKHHRRFSSLGTPYASIVTVRLSVGGRVMLLHLIGYCYILS